MPSVKRRVRPWKRTERDRGYMRRKKAADARAAAHVCDPTCRRFRLGREEWLA
jgi:hypothetical protein